MTVHLLKHQIEHPSKTTAESSNFPFAFEQTLLAAVALFSSHFPHIF